MASPVTQETTAATKEASPQRAMLGARPWAPALRRGLVARHPAAASIIAAAASRLLIFAVAFASSYWWGARLRHAPQALLGDRAVDANPLAFVLSAWRHWDAVWFQRIVEHGYGRHSTAFFPLYPLLVRVAALGTGRVTAAGVIVSVACFAAAMLLLYRLVRDDFDSATAAWTVILLSFSSMSFFFQAVYSESLFLLLTVACFSAARRGRWVLAGLAGGLAALTRSAGVLLVIPLAWMWFEQYRGGAIRLPGAAAAQPLLSRTRPHLISFATLALVPAGLGVYVAYLSQRFGNPLEFMVAEKSWHRSLHLPTTAVYDGAQAALHSVRSIAADPSVFLRLERLPWRDQWVTLGNLTAFLAVVLALLLLAACWRRLPSAYTVLAVITLLLPLSYPTRSVPLLSFPRFLVVDFPVFVVLGLLVVRRPVLRWVLLATFAAGLAIFTVIYANGMWVA
jgi:Mannosyltransferase (PIG-V)